LIGLSSPSGRDLLTRAAAPLNVPSAVDCIGVDIKNQTVLQSHLSGKTIAKIKIDSESFICGIRPNSYEATERPFTTD
jgi:electron transfer flavoprotein alpha subunit